MKPNKRELQHDIVSSLKVLRSVERHFKTYGGPDNLIKNIKDEISRLEDRHEIKAKKEE